MIGADAYCIACCLKRAQVFTVSIRNIQYQAGKKAKAETDPKNIVPQEYHNFLDVFHRKTQTLSLHIESMITKII